MGLDATFRALRDLGGPVAGEVAIAALLEPQPAIQEQAVLHFLQTEDRAGLSRAVTLFHQFAPKLQGRLASEVKLLLPALRERLKDSETQTRLNVVECVGRMDRNEVYSFLPIALQDTAPEVRRRAAEVLRDSTQSFLHSLARESEEDLPPAVVEARRRSLLDALISGLRTYDTHREKSLLFCMLDLGPSAHDFLLGVLAGAKSALRSDLEGVLRHHVSRSVVAFLFRMQRESAEDIRTLAVETFETRSGRHFAMEILGHLGTLEAGALHQLASHAFRLPWWGVVREVLQEAPSGAAQKLAIYVEHSRIGDKERMGALRDLLGVSDPRARAAAVRQMLPLPGPEAGAAVREAANDGDEEVQRIVLEWTLKTNPPDRQKILTAFLTSPHEAIRRSASRELSKGSFERYVKSFDALDERTRELAGRAIAKIDDQMVDRLTDELHSLDPHRKLKALRIIEITQKEKDIEPALMELINDPDRKVRASVIKLVGLLGDVRAIKVLIGALSDPDRRTRANAVEAFEDIGNPRLNGLLVPFLKDPDNRVRANAAKALWNLGVPETKDVIEEMLHDPVENMRLSAVWALGEINYPGVRVILGGVAERDASPVVRKKAQETLQALKEK